MTAQAHEFSLQQRYALDRGVVLLSGIQALVRGVQTRAWLDRQRGLYTAGFISGYRGSPLGGLDKELWSQSKRLEALDVRFQPGVNEDLAATAVWGSQQVGLHPGHRVQGVYGLWYGKAPGLDRSCDAIRHANAWGTSALGGVLLVVGDDPAAKSSSLMNQSEFTLQDLMVPILHPAGVQDVLDYAVLGWEMSRQCGVWVGLKAIADQMDSAATIEVGLHRYQHVQAQPVDDVHIRRDDSAAAQEQRLLHHKLPAAVAFARQAGINEWLTRDLRGTRVNGTAGTRRAVGVVCAGKAYTDVREALALAGLTDIRDIADAGIELLKLGMTWPLDPDLVRDFAAGVDRLLVVEEKRAFVEPQIKEILYGHCAIPVLGKRDEQGRALLPDTGVLDPAAIADWLVGTLGLTRNSMLRNIAANRRRLADLDAPANRERTPLFCAGCPHNTSTRVPATSRATAGIGCHYMAQWMGRATDSCTQMGGEGVTWVGEAPFTREPHIFANLGDGTYFHSGLLAIRQAVAAGVNITYKILFNDAVAMTGGQPTDGELRVADVVAQVRAEGVAEVVVVSDQPELHAHLEQVRVEHREKLDAVQRHLREVRGVTVLVYQQTCATELRRRRKRGLVGDHKPRLFINEAVCEGCGDCSAQSNCVAVEPAPGRLGVKRRINQSTCNKDLSCAQGFCPAFVEVTGGAPADRQLPALESLASLPQPEGIPAERDLLITGVGGTGIVTLSALLAAAARIDGKQVRTLDMTGLAQKGGAVFGHVRIREGELFAPRIPPAGALTLLACDVVSAASSDALQLMSPRALAVVNTHVTPTAGFVLDHDHDPRWRERLGRIRDAAGDVHVCSADESVEAALGDTQQTNVFLLGYAWQTGGVPVSLAALEQAIRVNGNAVERNLVALHLGRTAAELEAGAGVNADRAKDAEVEAVADLHTGPPQNLEDLIEDRIAHLREYAGAARGADGALAARYERLVRRVAAAEHRVSPGSKALARAVAESYARVLAVKDEFEVARLYTDPGFRAQLDAQFGPGSQVRYLLAPPLLGQRKRRFGGWLTRPLRWLAALRGVRNTWLDPFAWTAERKQALGYVGHVESLVERLLAGLTLHNLPTAVALARLPGSVRGFGHVRGRHHRLADQQEQALWAEFDLGPVPVKVFDPATEAA